MYAYCCQHLPTSVLFEHQILEALTGKEIAHNRLAQSDASHKQNIQVLLDFAQALGVANGETRWSVDGTRVWSRKSILVLDISLCGFYEMHAQIQR